MTDLPEIIRLNLDPEVMRYVGEGKPRSPEITEAGLKKLVKMALLYPGLGVWRADEIALKAFVGIFMIVYLPKTVEVEIGYRLIRSAWGRGFATEGASALLRHAFEGIELDRVIAVTHVENLASQKVLRKIGLRDRGTANYYNKQVRYFVAERTKFLAGIKAV